MLVGSSLRYVPTLETGFVNPSIVLRKENLSNLSKQNLYTFYHIFCENISFCKIIKLIINFCARGEKGLRGGFSIFRLLYTLQYIETIYAVRTIFI